MILAIAQPKDKTYFFRVCNNEKEATMIENAYGVFGDVIMERSPDNDVQSWIEDKKLLARKSGYKGGNVLKT